MVQLCYAGKIVILNEKWSEAQMTKSKCQMKSKIPMPQKEVNSEQLLV